jgi:hypothetical protein
MWSFIALLLGFQGNRTNFRPPAGAASPNECAWHPSSLSTIHGIGQAASSTFRTIDPALGGYWYGVGLKHGVIGTAWWGISLVAILAIHLGG